MCVWSAVYAPGGGLGACEVARVNTGQNVEKCLFFALRLQNASRKCGCSIGGWEVV